MKKMESKKSVTHKVLPLKNLKSDKRTDKIRPYLIFCYKESEFLAFLSENSYIRNKYKFFMITEYNEGGLPSIQSIESRYGLFRTKIAFLDCFLQHHGETGQTYMDQVEFAHCMANGTPVPERLIPSSIKNMMDDE